MYTGGRPERSVINRTRLGWGNCRVTWQEEIYAETKKIGTQKLNETSNVLWKRDMVAM